VTRLNGFPFQTFLSTEDKKTVTSPAFADQQDMAFPADSAKLNPRIAGDRPQSGEIRIFKENKP
jgi:hypothetical protein